jgi:hypothetical protein
MKTKTFFLIIAGLTFGLLVGLLAVSQLQFDSPVAQASELQQPNDMFARTITVVGEGKVEAAPDIAVVQIGVQVIDADVKEATGRAAEAMNSLLAALKGEGVAEKDIQTSYYSVYVERPYDAQGPSDQVQYQVSNNMQVTIRELDRVTEILGVAIESGANSINSVEFRLSDTSDLQSEARAEAVDKAQDKAEELAELNGVAVGEVVRISEVVDQGAYFVSEQSYAAADTGFGGGAGPISPGDVTVTAQLQITYAILQ